SPVLRMPDDRPADRVQRVAARAPRARAHETPPPFQVEIVAGAFDLLPSGEAEPESRVGLVGRLVTREARITIDAEERAARRPRVGDDVGADRTQLRRDRRDEREERLSHLSEISVLVPVEPVTLVVFAQFLEEAKELRGQAGSRRASAAGITSARARASCPFWSHDAKRRIGVVQPAST